MVKSKLHKLICAILLAVLLCAPFFRGNVVKAAGSKDAKLNVTCTSIVRGKSFLLKVYNLSDRQTVRFTSENEAVATVNMFGRIIGIGSGTTNIKAEVLNPTGTVASTLYCQTSVGPAALSVKFSNGKNVLVVPAGEKRTLKTYIVPSNSVETARFLSLDYTVASVTSTGRVKGLAPGETYVKAILANNECAQIKVVVIDATVYEALVEANLFERYEDSFSITDQAEREAEVKSIMAMITDQEDESSSVPGEVTNASGAAVTVDDPEALENQPEKDDEKAPDAAKADSEEQTAAVSTDTAKAESSKTETSEKVVSVKVSDGKSKTGSTE